MNIEEVKKADRNSPVIDDLDFDFKPITSGLGFHHPKTTEVKPALTERTVVVSPLSQAKVSTKKEMNIYQNDLSLFYGQAQVETPTFAEDKITEEKSYQLASKAQRISAYILDLLLVASVIGIVLTLMARTISMDLLEIWSMFPHEITPLVTVLFCGFYLIYFSIFEKTNQSTLGKFVFGLRVVGSNNKPLSISLLLVRATVSLLNFVSLGLFSFFDLQSKITSSKVIRID